MSGRIAAIYRYPIKGFTPEPLARIAVAPDKGLAHDRAWAVENGPSGFDPDAPTTVPKQKYTVLMTLPRVAAARTRYDDATGILTATCDGRDGFSGRLGETAGRAAFAEWLSGVLGHQATGPLRVLEARGEYRFTDHPRGQISIINLASVRDLGARMGVELDPLRFRGNLHVEGWPAWVENEMVGQRLSVGAAEIEVVKRIRRCLATHVNPMTAERDLDITQALFDAYGHVDCGIYVRATTAAEVRVGDALGATATAAA